MEVKPLRFFGVGMPGCERKCRRGTASVGNGQGSVNWQMEGDIPEIDSIWIFVPMLLVAISVHHNGKTRSRLVLGLVQFAGYLLVNLGFELGIHRFKGQGENGIYRLVIR